MKCLYAVGVSLHVSGLAAPAPGQERPTGQGTVKTFTYTKTKQADLEMHVHFPPGWKEGDKRPGIEIE
jgi:hypothetical protein